MLTMRVVGAGRLAVGAVSALLVLGVQEFPSTAAVPQRAAAAPVEQARVPGHPCGFNPNVVCGRIKRPLDPARPAAGSIPIHYELIPRSDRSRPSLGTIVAVEGGPGYASTASIAYYRDLFEPLLDRRQLLLVDQRGTGRSGVIRCPRLQSYQGNRVHAVGKCGRSLGAASDVYGSRNAADDMAAVLDHLGIGKVDMYGDSYGTFFTQTFAVRHPDRVRTIILDGAYFVGGTDPWYSDTNRALRYAFTVACERSPACADRPDSAMQRIRRLADAIERHGPFVGRAPNAEGVVRRVFVGTNRLIDLLTGAATSPTIYRELDAAIRAALRPHPYIKPLLRLGREVRYVGGAGPYLEYSEGMFLAVSCLDYPQPFDITSPPSRRPRQFDRRIAALRERAPGVFGPFTVRQWVRSGYGYFDDCLEWPVPSRWIHPVRRDAVYPDVPTLVIDGDLDSLTSPEGAKATAAAFPNSTYVETHNMTHVSAIIDFNQCASVIVRRFVRTRDAGDTSCAARYHENRLVDTFARTAAQTGWSGDRGLARVANATLADALARWPQMYGRDGVGLQGGSFHSRGGGFTKPHPVVRYRLDRLRWVSDVAVDGTMRWHRKSGRIVADVSVDGPQGTTATLHLTWNDLDRHARAQATGTVDGRVVDVRFPSA